CTRVIVTRITTRGPHSLDDCRVGAAWPVIATSASARKADAYLVARHDVNRSAVVRLVEIPVVRRCGGGRRDKAQYDDDGHDEQPANHSELIGGRSTTVTSVSITRTPSAARANCVNPNRSGPDRPSRDSATCRISAAIWPNLCKS